MCPPGCYHNGFMATPELGHRMYGSRHGHLPGRLLQGITSVNSTKNALATTPFITPTRFAVRPLQGTKITLNYLIILCPIYTFKARQLCLRSCDTFMCVCVYVCVWIFENVVNVNTSTLTLLAENTQDFSFNQPQTVCQHTAQPPTQLVSDWLAFGR